MFHLMTFVQHYSKSEAPLVATGVYSVDYISQNTDFFVLVVLVM